MDAINLNYCLAVMDPAEIQKYKDKAIDYAIANGPKILTAVVILVIGWIVANWVAKTVLRALNKRELEPPVKMLITRVIKLLVFGLAVISALDQAGVNVLTLVAGVSVVGVGIGLAMQGVLSNMCAGLTIIFTKPFRVGQYVEIAGVQGQVVNIDLMATTLLHADLSHVVVPNKKIVGEILHNYGSMRQLDLSVGIAYGSDVTEAIAVVQEILASNKRILKDPAPGLGVSSLADGTIMISIKPWALLPDAGPAGAEINAAIADRIRNKKISTPVAYREIKYLNPTPMS